MPIYNLYGTATDGAYSQEEEFMGSKALFLCNCARLQSVFTVPLYIFAVK